MPLISLLNHSVPSNLHYYHYIYLQDKKDEVSQPNTLPAVSLSAEARARLILDADNISFNTKLHVFNIKGLSGVTRVVTLFPNQTCSCPSTGDCYHIVAAKLCVGMPTSTRKGRKLNLTQLRRNTRSRTEKRSGRKRPRPNDVEIEGEYCFTQPC